MSRGPISDADTALGSPLPVRANVPGLFLDDELYLSLCGALDDLLAPMLVAMDCLPTYFDPAQAPEDFLPWLAEFVGSAPGRSDIAAAVNDYGRRGTAAGLRSVAAAAAGVALRSVEVDDPGGVTWSTVAGSAPAGNQLSPVVSVKVVMAPGSNQAAVSAAVHAALEPVRPVHCLLRIEMVSP